MSDEKTSKSSKSLDKGYEKFMKATGPEVDEVSAILRGHLLVEFYLDQIILSRIPRGDILLDNKFTFPQKVSLVESLDFLPRETVDSIKKLNSVRNRCAHDLEYTVTEGDIDNIGRPYNATYRNLKTKYSHSLKLLLHWTLALSVTNLHVAAENPDKTWKKYNIPKLDVENLEDDSYVN